MSINRKREWHPKLPFCDHCQKITYHYTWACPYRPRKRMRNESNKSRTKRLQMNQEWLKENPPDHDGKWACYLRIAPNCLKRMGSLDLTFEHVEPKVKRPDLKFDKRNIKAACQPCNELKGSRTITKLAIEYPHLKELL